MVVAPEPLPFAEPWVDGAQGSAAVNRMMAQHLQTHPLKTPVAVVAGYIVLDPGGAQRIDYFLVDAQGTVIRRLAITQQNQMFLDAAPRTTEDCTKLLIRALETRYDLLGS